MAQPDSPGQPLAVRPAPEVTGSPARPSWRPPSRRRHLAASWLDSNGDGFADLAIGAPAAAKTFVFLGGRGGAAALPSELSGADQSGAALAPAGDLNGDGFGDLLVGSGLGTATTFWGGAGGPGLGGVELGTDQALRVGTTVSAAGDVNGDGFADLIVGTRYGALLYLGTAAGPDATPAQVVAGPGAAAESVVGGVDFNHDGFADVAVGSGNIGVNVYLGSAAGLGSTASVTLAGTGGAASAGDVNGDGYSDLLVAAPGGKVQVYAGGRAGVWPTPLATLGDPAGAPLGDAIGLTMSSAGDVNHDGFDDVVLGSLATPSAFLFLGGHRGPGASPTAILAGAAGSRFGAAVAGVGDVDGDGFDDVVVGAPDAAQAFWFRGGAAGLGITPAATLSGPASFGTSVARLTR